MRTIAAVSANVLFAASLTARAQTVPVRTLAPVNAKTTVPVRTVTNLRQMAGGKLLVNDAISRQLYLFDSTLASFSVLRDSAAGLPTSYGPRAAVVLPYIGDSSLFVDNASQTLVVIDPAGRFGHVMAPAKPGDLPNFSRAGSGADARGRVIYEGFPIGVPPVAGEARQVTLPADSAPLLRADFDSRRTDTIGRIRIVAQPKRITTMVGNQRHQQSVVNPLQSIDGWVTLPDGSVAVVRGHDYHIDWIGPDGSTTSSPKLPFDWRRLTDDDKQRLADSVHAVQLRRDSLTSVGTIGGRGGCIRIENGRDVTVPCNITTEMSVVPLDEISDYYPPIRSGAVKADLDNNIWILPTTTAQSQNGELVYDVVNRNGELFERVRLPEGRSIGGFGPRGVVYLMWKDGDKGWYIERTHVVR